MQTAEKKDNLKDVAIVGGLVGGLAIAYYFLNKSPNPPPPPGSSGKLKVNTTPVRGKVFIKDTTTHELGTAPVEATLNIGQYTLSFGDVAGFTTPAPRPVTITANRTTEITETYAIIPTMAGVSITTTPPGEIFFDGKSIGTSPQTVITSPGEHTISYGDLDGWVKPVEEKVTLIMGQTTPITRSYTQIPPSMGAIYVKTRPVGGDIFINLVLEGNSIVSKAVAPNLYEVSFGDIDGYQKPVRQIVAVNAGKQTSVLGEYISTAYGTLNIQTILSPDTPFDAEVFLDGMSLGTTPFSGNFSPGTYTISYKDYENLVTPPSQTINIVNGQTIQVTGEYGLIMANIRIHTQPVVGEVYFDSNSLGEADPYVDIQASPGVHYITCMDVPGYNKPSSKQITVEGGQYYEFTRTYIDQKNLVKNGSFEDEPNGLNHWIKQVGDLADVNIWEFMGSPYMRTVVNLIPGGGEAYAFGSQMISLQGIPNLTKIRLEGVYNSAMVAPYALVTLYDSANNVIRQEALNLVQTAENEFKNFLIDVGTEIIVKSVRLTFGLSTPGNVNAVAGFEDISLTPITEQAP